VAVVAPRTYAPLPTNDPGLSKFGLELRPGGTNARVGLEAMAEKSEAGLD